MWNTGVETPSAILCGLLATKIVQYQLEPVLENAPRTYEFPLKSQSIGTDEPRKIRVSFYVNSLESVEVYNKSGDRLYGQKVTFTDSEQMVLVKAYKMLDQQALKLHAAWKVEQNQNKALKLIEGLVE